MTLISGIRPGDNAASIGSGEEAAAAPAPAPLAVLQPSAVPPRPILDRPVRDLLAPASHPVSFDPRIGGETAKAGVIIGKTVANTAKALTDFKATDALGDVPKFAGVAGMLSGVTLATAAGKVREKGRLGDELASLERRCADLAAKKERLEADGAPEDLTAADQDLRAALAMKGIVQAKFAAIGTADQAMRYVEATKAAGETAKAVFDNTATALKAGGVAVPTAAATAAAAVGVGVGVLGAAVAGYGVYKDAKAFKAAGETAAFARDAAQRSEPMSLQKAANERVALKAEMTRTKSVWGMICRGFAAVCSAVSAVGSALVIAGVVAATSIAAVALTAVTGGVGAVALGAVIGYAVYRHCKSSAAKEALAQNVRDLKADREAIANAKTGADMKGRVEGLLNRPSLRRVFETDQGREIKASLEATIAAIGPDGSNLTGSELSRMAVDCAFQVTGLRRIADRQLLARDEHTLARRMTKLLSGADLPAKKEEFDRKAESARSPGEKDLVDAVRTLMDYKMSYDDVLNLAALAKTEGGGRDVAAKIIAQLKLDK